MSKSKTMKRLGADPELMDIAGVVESAKDLQTNWNEGGMARAHYRDALVDALVEARLISPIINSLNANTFELTGLQRFPGRSHFVAFLMGAKGSGSTTKAHGVKTLVSADHAQALSPHLGRSMHVQYGGIIITPDKEVVALSPMDPANLFVRYDISKVP